MKRKKLQQGENKTNIQETKGSNGEKNYLDRTEMTTTFAKSVWFRRTPETTKKCPGSCVISALRGCTWNVYKLRWTSPRYTITKVFFFFVHVCS